MRWSWIAAVLAGCNFSHGVFSRGGDAAVDDVQPIDAPADAMMTDSTPPSVCVSHWLDGTVRFGAAATYNALGTGANERDPFLSADEKTVYFASDRAGSVGVQDVYVATRAAATGAFGTAVLFAAGSTDADDSKISFTDDGLYMVVASTKNGTLNGTTPTADLLDATRATTTGSFSTPIGRTYTAAEGTSADELDPFVTGDGLELYFSLSLGAAQHIVHASRASRNAPFGAPADIPALTSGAGDADPTLSADGRVILFSSSRTVTGFQFTNLWYAVRTTVDAPWGTPQLIPDVNTDFHEGDPWLSADGCRLYFATTRFADYDIISVDQL